MELRPPPRSGQRLCSDQRCWQHQPIFWSYERWHGAQSVSMTNWYPINFYDAREGEARDIAAGQQLLLRSRRDERGRDRCRQPETMAVGPDWSQRPQRRLPSPERMGAVLLRSARDAAQSERSLQRSEVGRLRNGRLGQRCLRCRYSRRRSRTEGRRNTIFTGGCQS